MHILDLTMWFATSILLWKIMAYTSNGDLTHEIGALIGIKNIIIYTIGYIIVFVWPIDINWIDVFHGVYNVNLSNWFKW